MIPALMMLGVLVEGAAWWWIASTGASVWRTMTPVFVVLGVLALLTGRPEAAPDVSPALAAIVGLGAGLALYLATWGFVRVVAPRWGSFRTQSVSMYGRRGALPLGAALALAGLLMVPGEELFWRGLFLPELRERMDSALIATLGAWVAFVVANLPSRNLAIVAGAMVGGAVWVALAVWSGGVLAGLLCHVVWTVLMLGRPPIETPIGEGA